MNKEWRQVSEQSGFHLARPEYPEVLYYSVSGLFKLKRGKLHMKNILLGTSVLVGAAALFAGAANADTPKVTLGGNAAFEGVHVSDDQDAGHRSSDFFTRNTLTVRVDAKTDAGLGYGAGMDLLADTTQDANNAVGTPGTRKAGGNAKRTFLYVDGVWGRVEGGSDYGVEQTMKVDAGSIARATGGISGDWTLFANNSAAFLATPDLPLVYGVTNLGDDSEKSTNKITYYTPRFAGFQAGVSYVADALSFGQTPNFDKTLLPTQDIQSIWIGALSYEGKFSDISINLAATGERGDAVQSTREDLRAWNVGGKVGYLGFSAAGSYGNLGATPDAAGVSALKSANEKDTTYWTVGGAYETGPFGASITYLNSTRGTSATTHNDLSNISVGVDYKLAPGLTPYVEANWYDQNATGTVNDNKGTVVIVGSQLSF